MVFIESSNTAFKPLDPIPEVVTKPRYKNVGFCTNLGAGSVIVNPDVETFRYSSASNKRMLLKSLYWSFYTWDTAVYNTEQALFRIYLKNGMVIEVLLAHGERNSSFMTFDIGVNPIVIEQGEVLVGSVIALDFPARQSANQLWFGMMGVEEEWI